MNIWRLMTHHEDPTGALSWTRRNGRIAIGWGLIGYIAAHGYNSSTAIGSAIRRAYPTLNNSGDGGPSLWNLYNEMKVGDLVILSAGGRRSLVVEVTGPYDFVAGQSPLEGNYQHQRSVDITKINPDALWHKAGGKPSVGHNPRATLIKCLKSVDERDL